MAGSFEIKTTNSGQFHFVLKARNGEIILSGEEYKVKLSAEKGVASVKANAPTDARYERKVAKDGSPFFVLKATNGKTIGQSETYSTEAARDKGIAAVKSQAPAAKVVDLTAPKVKAKAKAAPDAKPKPKAKAAPKVKGAPTPAADAQTAKAKAAPKSKR